MSVQVDRVSVCKYMSVSWVCVSISHIYWALINAVYYIQIILEVGGIIPIQEMEKLRFRKMKWLPRVTQLFSGRTFYPVLHCFSEILLQVCGSSEHFTILKIYLLDILGWHWLIKLHRFQVDNSIIHHLYIVLCVHQSQVTIYAPFPLFYLLPSPFPSGNPYTVVCVWGLVFLCFFA